MIGCDTSRSSSALNSDRHLKYSSSKRETQYPVVRVFFIYQPTEHLILRPFLECRSETGWTGLTRVVLRNTRASNRSALIISLPSCSMRSTTKLKHILQLYTVTLDMNEDGEMQLMIFDKRDNSSEEFINKSYSIVVDKAFRYMMKKLPSKRR